jgi:MoaA/NifB/PqqE/SkfB family radical SAM enzyme
MKDSLDEQAHRTLSLMPTFRCTAECKNCGTLSNPRTGGILPLQQMTRAVDEAAGLNYNTVVFTGGEATLAGEDLLSAMRHAAFSGFRTRLVTNAHWASDKESARTYLGQLVDAGLMEINYSTGDQHARFVPVDNIFFALEGAVERALPVTIIIELTRDGEINRQTFEGDERFRELAARFPYADVILQEWTWSPLGAFNREEYPDQFYVNEENLESRTGCEGMLGNLTVQPDGKIASCCGLGMRVVPELTIGKLDESGLSEAEQNARRDPLNLWIRDLGPEKILAWAAKIDPRIKWQNMYAHRCQACIRLFKDPKVRDVIDHHAPWVQTTRNHMTGTSESNDSDRET